MLTDDELTHILRRLRQSRSSAATISSKRSRPSCSAPLRLLRLAGGISKRAADEIIPGEIIPKAIVSPIDVAPEPVRVAPKRRHAAKKIVHKKSAAVRKRGKRVKQG
jgi:hypothetical protein